MYGDDGTAADWLRSGQSQQQARIDALEAKVAALETHWKKLHPVTVQTSHIEFIETQGKNALIRVNDPVHGLRDVIVEPFTVFKL